MGSGDLRSVGEYTLARRLHANARARSAVWQATDSAGQLVALKLLAREADPGEQAFRLERFQAEVESGQVLHEHVRRLLAFGTEMHGGTGFPDGVDWLAFEWVEGGTLEELLTERRAAGASGLRAREWRDLVRAVANGLAAMHRQQPPWIHRDVKPANILLPAGDCRAALLADLGIAWRSGSPRLSRVAGRSDSGTPLYMAPEQFTGADDPTPATDLYALALVAWEAASGELPHTQSSLPSDIARARLAGASPGEFTLEGRAAPSLERVLAKALHTWPGSRYSTVEDFWQDLHAAGMADERWDPDISVGTPAAPLIPRAATPHRLSRVRSDLEVAGTWVEQHTHTRSFVGRTDFLNRCRSWIRGESSEPYLVLIGPPGQGKSALMAALAAGEGTVESAPAEGPPRALLHMVKSHRDGRRILQSLISQCDTLLDEETAPDTFRGDTDTLREALTARLGRVADRIGKVTVFIDALDELGPESRRCEFLPPRLPTGVRCVLSSRPDADLLSALEHHVGRAVRKVVPPLTEHDTLELLSRAFGIGRETAQHLIPVADLVSRTGGSPLVVKYAIEQLRSQVERAMISSTPRHITLGGVASSTETVFREIYASLAGRRAIGDALDRTRRGLLIKVLACAQAPLTIEQVRSVLSAGGHPFARDVVQGYIDDASQFLLPLPDRLALFHKGFEDYVREHVLGPDGLLEVHGWFLAWLARATTDAYYRLHVADHYRERWTISRAESGDLHTGLDEWMAEVLSLTYVRARVEAREVYELREILGAPFFPLVDVATRTAVKGVDRYASEFGRLAEWLPFLDRHAHVLVAHPHLLLQQLRNDPEVKTLKADALAADLARPALLVREHSPAGRGISRLVRQTVSCGGVRSIAMHQSGHYFATSHFGEVRVWSAEGKLAVHQRARAKYGDFALLPQSPQGCLAVASPDDAAAFHILGTAASPADVISVRWPASGVSWDSGVATRDALFVAFVEHVEDTATRVLNRYDVESGLWSTIIRVPEQVGAVAASPDARWVALAMQTVAPDTEDGESEGPSEIWLVDAGTGDVVHIERLPTQTFGLAFTESGLLLSGHRDEFAVWDVPSFRKLWAFPRHHVPFALAVVHPSAPRLLLIDAPRVQVVDLDRRQVVRTETWHEAPVSHARLMPDGATLVGDLGNMNDPLAAEDSPIGMWSLPAEFWQACTETPEDTDPPATTLENRAFALSDGTVVSRPAAHFLLQFDGDATIPSKAFAGSMLQPGSSVAPLANAQLLITHHSSFHIVDVGAGRVVREIRAMGAAIHASWEEAGERFVFWERSDESPVAFSPSWAADRVMSELLASSVPVYELAQAVDTRVLPPFDWGPNVAGGFVWAMSRINLEDATISGFTRLPALCYRPDSIELMPDGRAILVSLDTDSAWVVQIASGQTLQEVHGRVLTVLDGARVLWCDSDGKTYVTDVYTGECTTCGVDLDWYASVRSDLAFALSPDQQLAVWNSIDGVIVCNLSTGQEIARFPIPRFDGSLTFLSPDRIEADDYRRGRFVLDLKIP